MAGKFDQFLGLAFEGAFKLGFLKDRLNDYSQFKKAQVFEKLRQEYILKYFVELEPTWELLEKNIPFDPRVDLPEELRELGLQDNRVTQLNFVFLTGFYEGYFYGQSFNEVELIKYALGEESSQPGVYHNADLIFKSNRTLYVIDFKLSGVRSQLSKMITQTEPMIPFRNYGLPVNLALGEVTFEGFLDCLIQLEDELFSLQMASPELKGFLQVVSYAVDFLCNEESQDLKEVCLALFYPLSEPFVTRFYLKNKDFSQFHEKITNLYTKLQQIESEYKQIEKPSFARIRRLREEISEKIENLKQEIEKREKQSLQLYPESIENARNHVAETLDRFFRDPSPVKAICLFHSAGSGKTTNIRKRILQLNGNHIVLYMATRKVLLFREKAELSRIAKKYNLRIVFVEPEYKISRYVTNVGDTFREVSQNNKGILQKTVREIKDLTTEDYRFIWAFATQQSLVETEYGKITSRYLRDLLSKRILDNYVFHFILDEFFGDESGLFTVEELLKILNEIKSEGGKANLYLLDANGFAPPLLPKLLKEYREFQVMPDATIICDYLSECVFREKDIKVYVSARHAYPSPKINIVKKFIFLPEMEKSKEDTKIKEIAEYIERTFRAHSKNNTALVFLQNRDDIAHLGRLLKEKGFEYIVATANSSKSQDEINRGSQDIILATSAISRGIDLSRPHKPVNHIYTVIFDWGIERNMVELIQAISRARGDMHTETQPKTIHLIYLINPPSDKYIESIISYLEEDIIDKDLIKSINEKIALQEKIYLDDVITHIITQFIKTPEEKARVLVPLGEQYKRVYIPNKISELQGCLSFLKDIHELEHDDELKKDVRLLIKELTKSLYVSVVGINFKNAIEYYHPYLLFNSQRVRFGFDNINRGRTIALFKKIKPVLEKHNKEKAAKIEGILNNLLPMQEDTLPVLIPVYSLLLVRHFLKVNSKLEFLISKSVGRGRAETLLGSEKPRTYCFNGGDEKEYACIPLEGEYPYREVLSGRFVKFPVEFIKYLLERKDD